MSAFIVSDTHINTIVTWAVQQHLPLFIKDKWVYAHEGENAQMFAAMLYAANVRSVNHRYSERTRTTGFVFQPWPVDHLTPIAIIKLCHCLDYQSCEVKQWARSDAKRFLDAVIDNAIRHMPGYNEARWSI